MIITSDLHVREDAPLLLLGIEIALREDDDKVLIIPGDVTQNGEESEYAVVEDWFRELIQSGIKIVLTTGNHDISRRLHIISFVKDTYKARFRNLLDLINTQNTIVARKDCDIVYRIGKDVFCSLRSTHARHVRASRISKMQYNWAGSVLRSNGLLKEKGFRLHLVTHHSLWRSSGNDVHMHMHKKRRLVDNFLKPFGFSTAINGHNHRFDSGLRELKGYYIFHIQAPTLSTKTKKGRFSPGYAIWKPSEDNKIAVAEVLPGDR